MPALSRKVVTGMLVNIIAVLVIALIVGAALAYIIKSKKKGVRCIGCPCAGTCSKAEPCGSLPKASEEES